MSEVMHLDDPLLALDDEEMAEHVSNCDECAAKLAADARLELALGELHAFRSGSRHIAKPSVIRVYFTPIVIVLAAAAALFFVLRSRHSGPALELRAEPTAAASTKPADLEQVIAGLRPRLRKCLEATVAGGGSEVVLEITIAGDGSVSNVELPTQKGVNDEVAYCLVTVVRGAHFQATGSVSTVRLPLTLVVSGK